MQGREVPGSEKERRRDRRLSLCHPRHAHISLGDRADIRCGLAGPRTERGMGVRPGMLVVIDGRGRMGEGTTRGDERQRQVDEGDPEGHDSG